MYDFLRKVPLFSDLPDDDLERLCELVEEIQLEQGTQLFAEGDAGDRAYIIKEGELEIVKMSGNREVLLAVRGSGEVIGEMALLADRPRMASVRAHTAVVLLAIHQDQLTHLLETSNSAARVLYYTVLNRWQATESLLRQSEKMAQLGRLTAGVAHELNNPAAAVQRSADQLQIAVADLQRTKMDVEALGLDPKRSATIQAMADVARQQAQRPAELDTLARSDREAELEDWLESHHVEDSWELAPILVNLGHDPDDLASIAASFSPHELAVIVRWLGAFFDVYTLLAEIKQGAGRVSEIVKALKSYSYLDQAPVLPVDLHQGLDDTLLILRRKLKDGISVHREYDPEVPIIQGYGSELNQVWTNIIDNAADALNGRGEIVLRTKRWNDWVVVEIIDNGPGIPEEIQGRLFEPFFTTKPPGQGTGLGLDISYNIVVQKHHGDIKVISHPGHTCFQVWLPINPEGVEKGSPPLPMVMKAADELKARILENARTIAVVGISADRAKPAHRVPAYLQSQGYQIIPVNPKYDQVLGEQAYPDLSSVPDPIDVVQIFRPSDLVLPHVEGAIQIGAKAIWMQLGISNHAAANKARRAGLDVVMDQCMMAEHRRLVKSG